MLFTPYVVMHVGTTFDLSHLISFDEIYVDTGSEALKNGIWYGDLMVMSKNISNPVEYLHFLKGFDK